MKSPLASLSTLTILAALAGGCSVETTPITPTDTGAFDGGRPTDTGPRQDVPSDTSRTDAGDEGLDAPEVLPDADVDGCVAGPVLCNGLDDDCDGDVDEGCGCVTGATRPCYTGASATNGVGACAAGVETCSVDGAFGACLGEVLPTTESCDGIDEDCDGTVDDGIGSAPCSTGLMGVCSTGTSMCGGGTTSCVQTTSSSSETCNGLDDNCDGATDEGLGGGECATGMLGVCATGMLTCTGGTFGCVAVTPASSETCNGMDDNCDGAIDEGLAGGMCDTGMLGACRAGTSGCVGGAPTCLPSTPASAETCNDQDDNCNGLVDEGLGGAPCTSLACPAGTTGCVGGVAQCNC